MHLIVLTHRATAGVLTSTYTLAPGATYSVPISHDTQALTLEVTGTSGNDGVAGAIDRQTERLGSLLDNLVTELVFQRKRADELERMLHASR